jgi:hypothetical protein
MMDELLKVWLWADNKTSEIKKTMAALQADMDDVEKEKELALTAIKEEMASTGEYEVLVPGEYCDYKIHYTAVRESVRVEIDAVPEEFCKIEKKPKLKEIKEYLEQLDVPPNWARMEAGQPKLTYKICKRA